VRAAKRGKAAEPHRRSQARSKGAKRSSEARSEGAPLKPRRAVAYAGASTAVKTDPALWRRVRGEAIAKMGGTFSARAMQLATRMYKARGGGYVGAKRPASNSLARWTHEDWGYAGQPGESRYLPKAVREQLTPSERRRTNLAKRRSTTQWSKQPPDVAAKAARIRKSLHIFSQGRRAAR
jgi:hypothetical protein